MMKLVYKLQAEEYKYELPVNYLPVGEQQREAESQSVCLSSDWLLCVPLRVR